ncbi:MAG: trehalose-phosphatase [Actinomycetota bacterium]|nr:trehalose-phosphatase [Actinomycetota bacterium]
MIERLASASSLLVASDFDGTLSELDDVLAGTPLPRSLHALNRLADAPNTTVAIVSGRRRSDLVARFNDRRFVLIGEHGADAGGGVLTESPALTHVREAMIEMAAMTPGAFVEHKHHSVVFHYRMADDPEPALDNLRRLAADSVGITLIDGKKMLEITDSTTNKGKAISMLRVSLAVAHVLFIGDDVTDETVFAALGPEDFTVHVGPGPTLARTLLPDTEAVSDFLEALADARGGG